MLGIVLGLTLVSGQLLNAYSVASTAAADIPKWDFGFFKVDMIGYQAQVLPAILAAFALVYLEKFFRKVTPAVISMIVVPFCSLLLAVVAAHFVIGPIGWKIGSACAAIVCVATSTTANAIGVGGIPGILSIQPKYMPTFAICMLIAIVIPFVLTFFVGKKKLQVVTDTSTEETDVEKETESVDNSAKAEKNVENKEQHQLKAFLTGEVIPLAEVNDGVFSAGIMGEGIAIRPEEDTMYAPVDAKVTVLMQESNHAVGLTLANGLELLIHVGIDTVDMQGDGFECLVTEGQQVTEGTPLIRFDREKIKAAGHPDVTVCVITDQGNVKKISLHSGMHAKAGETVIAEF